ncbi:hypothetical protein [Streptomyces sp. TP-A0875]|uniref:hypothetical protein n=1 Tax=Streptomyces sp. TP-A0875 TaxID=552354 RepID=UPI0006B55933|nr:hypothetical protein [Streptomyces sp. TP-A0875]
MFTKSPSGKRCAAGAAALATASAGLLLLTAPTAQALPDNCTISSGSTLSSLCTGGTGQHRIRAVLNAPDPRLPQRIVLGDWAPVGQASVAANPWGPGSVAGVWVDRAD